MRSIYHTHNTNVVKSSIIIHAIQMS